MAEIEKTSDELIEEVGTNIQEKANLIWSVADTLRGPFKPHEYSLVGSKKYEHGVREEYCKPKLLKYVATDFLRFH